MSKYNNSGQRDIERLENELNTKIYTTKEALKNYDITNYFLTKVSKSKINIKYNCYEQNLYSVNILENEIKNGVKGYNKRLKKGASGRLPNSS